MRTRLGIFKGKERSRDVSDSRRVECHCPNNRAGDASREAAGMERVSGPHAASARSPASRGCEWHHVSSPHGPLFLGDFSAQALRCCCTQDSSQGTYGPSFTHAVSARQAQSHRIGSMRAQSMSRDNTISVSTQPFLTFWFAFGSHQSGRPSRLSPPTEPWIEMPCLGAGWPSHTSRRRSPPVQAQTLFT